MVGPGFELQARLEQGQLLVDRLAAALWQGRLEAQASFDVGRPLPFMALALDLRAIDPSALAAWLDLPPVVARPGRPLRRGDRRRRQPARPDRRPDRRDRGRPAATAAWSASRWPRCACSPCRAATDSARRSTATTCREDGARPAGGRPERQLRAAAAASRRTEALPFQLDGREAAARGHDRPSALGGRPDPLRLDPARRPATDGPRAAGWSGRSDRPQIRLLRHAGPSRLPAQAPSEPLRRGPASSPAAPAGRTPRPSAGRARARPP